MSQNYSRNTKPNLELFSLFCSVSFSDSVSLVDVDTNINNNILLI